MSLRYVILLTILLSACRKADDLSFAKINVRDYGAVGNGVTDDTHAFDLAMTKADSLKLPVFVPVGVYKANVQLTHDGLHIIGEEQPNDSVSSGSIILGKIDCNYKRNVIIENIGIDSHKQLGPADDAALTSGVETDSLILNQEFRNISIIGDGYAALKHGILCQAGSGIIIQNVSVRLFYHGIAIRSGNVTIDNVNAISCGFTSIVVKSDQGKNMHTQNVSINHVNIVGDPSDVYKRGGSILVVSWGDALSKTDNVSIQNVYSRFGGEACVEVQQVRGKVDNVTIQNCVSESQGDNNQRACYDVAGGSNITFLNCTANNSLGYGFRSAGAVQNIRVQNSFEKNSGTDSWVGTFGYLQLNGIKIVK